MSLKWKYEIFFILILKVQINYGETVKPSKNLSGIFQEDVEEEVVY